MSGRPSNAILAGVRTQVAIVGAAPAGSLLAILLHRAGIETVVVERQTRQHVLDRVRAGVLEWGTVEVLREAGVAANLDRSGVVHHGARIAWAGRSLFFDIAAHTGRAFVAYGQAPLQHDLYDAAERGGIPIVFEVADVEVQGIESASPWVTFTAAGGWTSGSTTASGSVSGWRCRGTSIGPAD